MNKRPDSWEDPPEDDPVDEDITEPLDHGDPNDDGDYAYDAWKDRQMEADLNKDCDYWTNLK